MTQKALSLQQIFCQDKAISALQRAFGAGKMAHAYIFAGPDGVGRAATAKAWGKMLLCQKRVEKKTPEGVFFDSCGTCPSCLLFDGDGHPDFVSIYKELRPFTRKGKEKKGFPVDLPIDVVREFLIEKIANRPQMGEFAVYVVHEAEKLNDSGQNALLKTLEEPPGFCVVILLCSKTEWLLPTIYSRCQTIRFGPIDREHILAVLKRQGVAESAAAYWAGFCEGSLGQALMWATLDCGDKGGKSVYDIKKELIEKLGHFQLADTIELAEWLGQSAKQISAALGKVSVEVSTTDLNRRGQKLMIQMILWAVSDAMRVLLGMEEGLVNTDQVAAVKKVAEKLDSDRAGELVSQIHRKIQWVDGSVNEKLIFEGLLLNTAGLDIIAVVPT
jgi:DNA polymerase III delta' subunit